MNNQPGAPSIEALLAHADWVRALAGRLVNDPGRADDIAQDAWVAAIESPARDARNVQGWLAAIVRNTARELGRGDAQRTVRERAASKSESAVPSTDELVLRANLQREIAAHVVALPEPYRTVVLLRWYEGLLPREIAQRLGRPVDTVTTQLSRAHERLREKLDRDHGDRATWSALFVGLGLPQSSAAGGVVGGTVGGFLVATGWKIALGAIVFVMLGLALWRSDALSGSNSVAHPGTASAALAPADVSTVSGLGSDLSAGVNRTPVADAGASSELVASRADGLLDLQVRGRVVDERGAPIPGLRLRAHDTSLPRNESEEIQDAGGRTLLSHAELERLRAQPIELDGFVRAHPQPGLREAILGTSLNAEATTDAEGRYAFVVTGLEEHQVSLKSADPAWVLFTDGYEGPSRAIVHIAAPAITLAGEVVDPQGAPLEEAQISMNIFVGDLRELALELDTRTTSTGGPEMLVSGRFQWERVPRVSGWTFAVRCPGFKTQLVRIPHDSDEHMRIVLQRVRATPKLSGTVLDANGQAAVDATVLFGNASTRTDVDGRFSLTSLEWREQSDLIAAKPGAIPAIVPEFGRQIAADAGDIAGLTLRLGGTPLAIEGHVLSAANEPCAGWELDVYDGTSAGRCASVEKLSAGRNIDGGGPRTDASGAFRIEGLAARAYRVRALSPDDRLMLLSEPFFPGSGDFVLRVPADALRSRIAGRVVSTSGEPIEGASISIEGRTGENKEGWTYGLLAGSVATDKLGHFELANMPRYHVVMKVMADSIDKTIVLAPDMPGENLEIVFSRNARFHVELAAADLADAFEILDGHGQRLKILVHDSSHLIFLTRVPRDDAGFPACEVSEEAATLVLLRGESELRRVPIALTPGKPNVIRP